MWKLVDSVESLDIPRKIWDMLYQRPILETLDMIFIDMETMNYNEKDELLMKDYSNLELIKPNKEKIAIFLAYILNNPHLQTKFLQNLLEFIKNNGEDDEQKVIQTINTIIEFFQYFINIYNKRNNYLVPILQYNFEKDICEILSQVELKETNLQLINRGYPVLLEDGIRVQYMDTIWHSYLHKKTGATYVSIVDSQWDEYMIDETWDKLYDDEWNIIKSILFPILLDNKTIYYHIENVNEEQYVVDENMCVLRVCGERVDRMDRSKVGKFDSKFSFCALYTAAGTLMVDENLTLITIDYIKAYLSDNMDEFYNEGKATDVLFHDENIPSLYEKEMVEDVLDFVDIKGEKLMKIKTIRYTDEGNHYVQYYINKELDIFKDSKGYYITHILWETTISGQSFLLFWNGDFIIEGMIDLKAKVIEIDKKSIFSIIKLPIKLDNKECYEITFLDGSKKRLAISVLKKKLTKYKSIPISKNSKLKQIWNNI